ncbi:MlaD family protein [Nocardia sp. XZ_19_385]|uniref:MlaD family protein n=1 Tax=Nocardia sp. XZ_19_385 TaxID=2769488 RepID=UPI00188F9387|nr:MlaD family protein [Nocardia sp. XZ_19_385]
MSFDSVSEARTRQLGSLVSLLAIGTILVVGAAYLTFGVVKVDWFAERMTATMVVPDSGGLLPRSKVLLSGIEIGKVTTVQHIGAGIEVAFDYDADYRVPVTSRVRIEALSGLGEPYVEFRPTQGGGPFLRDGERVDAAVISAPVSIPDVARTATELLRQLDPKALSAIVANFSIGLAGTETVIPHLSRSTDLLAATLLSRTELIRKMLLDMQAEAEQMAWGGEQLSGASATWADFGPRVAEVAASIARIIRIGDTPADYLTDTEEMTGLVPLLNQVAGKVDKLGPELRKLLPVFEPLFAMLPGLISRIDLGALISQALHSTSPDGAVQLQIGIR